LSRSFSELARIHVLYLEVGEFHRAGMVCIVLSCKRRK
jgi:hypothetical protein